MSYIQQLKMINTVLELVNSDNRNPVPKQNLCAVLRILTRLPETSITARISGVLADMIPAIEKLTSTENLGNIPDNIKQKIIRNVYIIKTEIAKLAYTHYRFNHFEPTEDVIPIMREVVMIYRGTL
jgi:hypothetical protein